MPLELTVAGELAAFDSTPLVSAALRGLLETLTTERVNQINATHLAKARGLSVVERKTPDAGHYSSYIALSVGGSAASGGAESGGVARMPPEKSPSRAAGAGDAT